jgi:hypothetical protein
MREIEMQEKNQIKRNKKKEENLRKCTKKPD